MVTTLYLVRHGESLGNLRGFFLGHTDWGLSPRGEEQARTLAEALADLPFSAVYSSDLSRAVQTVSPAAAAHRLPVLLERDLREIYAGRWEGMAYEEIMTAFPEDRAVWKNDIGHARPTGGESVAELQARVLAALDRIAAAHPRETVLVGTHATPIRATVCALRGEGLDAMAAIPWVPNCSLTCIEYREGKPELIYTGRDDFLTTHSYVSDKI